MPRTIFVEDKLPLIRADPGYLARGGIEVLDRQVLDPSVVDGGRSTRRDLVQAPGPGNALGRVKFMFPNSLRRLPARHQRPQPVRPGGQEPELRLRADRAALRLADLLMEGDQTWSHARLEGDHERHDHAGRPASRCRCS
ncbi:MAG: hypothetical protein R3C69_11380 [Geminicoccaceae bacterium]